MNELHAAVVKATKELRSQLAAANIGSTFQCVISVSGRVEAGDVTISYKLCKDYGTATAGARLSPVVDEFLRRCGWNDQHAPLCLEDHSEDAAPAVAAE